MKYFSQPSSEEIKILEEALEENLLLMDDPKMQAIIQEIINEIKNIERDAYQVSEDISYSDSSPDLYAPLNLSLRDTFRSSDLRSLQKLLLEQIELLHKTIENYKQFCKKQIETPTSDHDLSSISD